MNDTNPLSPLPYPSRAIDKGGISGSFHGLSMELMGKNMSLLILGLLAVIGNCLILGIVAKYKSFRKEQGFTYLMAALAAADAINGFGAMIVAGDRLHVQILRRTDFTKLECIGASAVMGVGMVCSQILMASVGIDRLMAIQNATKYRMKDHGKFARDSVFFALFVSVFDVILMFANVSLWSKPPICNHAASSTFVFKMFWMLFSWSVACFIVVSYIVLLALLRQRIVKVLESQNESRIRHLMAEAKAAKAVILVLTTYLTLWFLPVSVLNLSTFFGVSPKTRGRIGPLIVLGSAASSALNIVVYGIMMKEFRKYLKKFFGFPEAGAVARVYALNDYQVGTANTLTHGSRAGNYRSTGRNTVGIRTLNFSQA